MVDLFYHTVLCLLPGLGSDASAWLQYQLKDVKVKIVITNFNFFVLHLVGGRDLDQQVGHRLNELFCLMFYKTFSTLNLCKDI